MIRQIEKAGRGGAIVFDAALRAVTGLKLGDRVKVEVLDAGGIVLKPCNKRTRGGKHVGR
jgi:bifunctional DNA-binding transcriptional regulator/antitoxin component of YhaV-PrlF toxin-antitoxin module